MIRVEYMEGSKVYSGLLHSFVTGDYGAIYAMVLVEGHRGSGFCTSPNLAIVRINHKDLRVPRSTIPLFTPQGAASQSPDAAKPAAPPLGRPTLP